MDSILFKPHHTPRDLIDGKLLQAPRAVPEKSGPDPGNYVANIIFCSANYTLLPHKQEG